LKSFFPGTNSTSGSNLGPSTHESDNVVVAESEEQEELRDSEPHPLETVQGVEHREPSSHEQDVEGIMLLLLLLLCLLLICLLNYILEHNCYVTLQYRYDTNT
jgi:hypothetical protein